MNLFSNHPEHKLSAEEIEVRIWAIVVLAITGILFFIVICLLYSVTFVVQPIKAMAPIDQAYTKMLNDIVLLLVGGIGGIVGKRVAGGVAGTLAGVRQATNPTPMQPCYGPQMMQPMAQPMYQPRDNVAGIGRFKVPLPAPQL